MIDYFYISRLHVLSQFVLATIPDKSEHACEGFLRQRSGIRYVRFYQESVFCARISNYLSSMQLQFYSLI